MRIQPLSRAWLIYTGIFLFAAILMTKLFYIQVIHGKSYSEKADRQYVAPSTSIFDRGTIFFTERDGDLVSAATLKSGFTVAINPSKVDDATALYTKLNEIIPIESDTFFIRASKKDDPYEEIMRRVSANDIEKIEALDDRSIIISRDKWRFYPGENIGSQLLGFVGYKDNTLAGRYGLERYYNDVLARDEDKLYINFFAEVFANIGDTIFNRQDKEGNIITSIEPSVQSILEGKLLEILNDWDSELVGGVIIDPRDGTIYALASVPDFNPNTFGEVKNPSVFLNPIVESVFEMGSIIKPLTMAAGLDAGVITAESEYNDKGYVNVEDARIENYDGKGRGVVAMQDVLNKSLNTGVVYVMDQLGRDRFRDYFISFGLTEETGIDLPNEVAGLTSNLNSKRKVEFATASFGQGIALSPIATVRALSVLGNGGRLITPHVVTSIDYKVGLKKSFSFNEGLQVLKPETSEEITRMLVNVVDEALLGGTVKMDNYSIAAKTGTAQIAREDGRGYDEYRFLHSFFGYFPAYDPQFLVFLFTVNPRGARYASETLTQPFISLTKFLINYYEIPPDR